ncbi:MAG: hypothetical protein ACP5N3_01515 [Candidatus Nanoarchaeia archaeon]
MEATIPVVRCRNCGKAHSISESILFNGMSFCSGNCKEEYFKLKAK